MAAVPDIEFHKQTLLYCMEGNAVELVQRIAPGTPRWAACNTMQLYLDAVKEIFCPVAESQLARAEFTARKQDKRESISSYLEHKFTLFAAAYPERNDTRFPMLLEASINGMYSLIIKKIVRRSNPQTEVELRQVAVQATANERSAFLGGYSESSNLGGLSAVTVTSSNSTYDNPEPMDIDRINSMKLKCYKCGNMNHKASECYARKGKFPNKW